MTMRTVVIALLALLLAACADPYGIYHKVRDKEDIQKISLLYKVDIDKIRSANSMGRADEVKPGDYLFIPGVRAPMDGTAVTASSQKKETGKTVPPGKQALATTRGAKGADLKATGDAKFAWPLKGVVTSPFGPRDGKMHEGIDISVPEGTPVFAAGGGKVIFSADHGGYGNVVIIQHADNYFTVYAHNRELLVKEGQTVKQGEKIALSGNTGRSSGPHLHFEVRIGAKPQDPMQYLPRAAP